MITNKLRFVETEEDGSQTVQKKKARLRAYMKERRGNNENRDVKEQLQIENFFKALEGIFPKSIGAGMRRTFFVYLSYSLETPTDGLIERLIADGQAVCCPRVEGVEMSAVEYGEDFSLSERGIREPIGKTYDGAIDVIVLPLLAVDERGARLGYGGGYYDRFLKAHPKAKRIAFCYDFQIVREVPTELHDEKVDVIVTDKRVLFIKR